MTSRLGTRLRARRAASKRRILIIVQNLPVPLDRRVWLECQALVEAGYRVSVICPKGPGDPSYAEIDGVRIFKYRPAPSTDGLLSYLFEFVYCWLRTAGLSLKVAFRGGFDVIQACNPPDTYWALARFYKLFGKKFVYDQHDLNPEVYRSRFGEPHGVSARLQYGLLTWLERKTYDTADHVIVTNDSYRKVAITRGKVDPEGVTVVRSGPNTARMRPIDGDPELRHGRDYLLTYLGIMGPQDGVDVVVRVMDVLVNKWGRRDVHAALLGFGDCYHDLLALTHQFGLADYITFTGRANPKTIAHYLSSAHVGISPDPFSPLNDVSTMNKTMEYMSYALPVVAFDLAETRVTGGTAVSYVHAEVPVTDDVIERFAKEVAELLDDPERRAQLAVEGRRRAESLLDWAPQRAQYLRVYDRLTGTVSPPPRDIVTDDSLASELGGELLDVTDEAAIRSFARTRRIPGRADPVDSEATVFPETILRTLRSIDCSVDLEDEDVHGHQAVPRVS